MAFPGRREGPKPCLHFFYKNKNFIRPVSHPACPNVALWVPQHFSLKRLRTLSHTALRGKAIPTLNVRISISFSLMGLDLHFAGREPNPCSTQERSLPLNRSTFLFKNVDSRVYCNVRKLATRGTPFTSEKQLQVSHVIVAEFGSMYYTY